MSNDNSDTSNKTQSARKKVFVIKANPNCLKSAENFLKNRTWEIISASDMKVALATLFRHNVDYAMIGVDHAHPHVLKLPEIVAQTIKIPVIMFAESMTPQAAQMLRTTKHPYVLFPPVSGPAIERMLLRIEKDKIRFSENATRYGEYEAAGDETVRISQNSTQGFGSADHSQMHKNFSEEDIAKLFEGDGLSAMLTAKEDGLISASMTQTQKAQSASTGAQPSGVRKGSSIDLTLWPQNVRPPSNSSSGQKAAPENFTPVIQDGGGYDRQIQTQSVLLNGTEHALNKSTVGSQSVEAVPIGNTQSSNVGCFAVHSAGVSGVIVVAYGRDRVVDRKFSKDLKDHLMIYMKENGIEFKIEDVMNLSIQQVAFQAWSEKEAVFLRKSIHDGCELALGFFINTAPQAKLEPSPHTHMLKMNIDEIRVDHSLEFDVYLYFPENGKYIRYVGKDGNLSGKQKDRLTAGGVKELHVKKEVETEITKYRMKNFLNDKVAGFNKKAS